MMPYESQPIINNDSLYCEHNTVVALNRAKAHKLGMTTEQVATTEDKSLVHEALKPLYDCIERMSWRIEYLFNAIKNTSEGKPLTPQGGYLKSNFHKYLTTDGRLQAQRAAFSHYFHSLSLKSEDGSTMAWANLSFEEMVDLRNHLTWAINRDIEDLRSNLEQMRNEADSSPQDIQEVEKQLADCEKLK